MSRKLNPVSAFLALAVLAVAASTSMAQVERLRQEPVGVGGGKERPTLGCCKCLGGTNTLDLSTVGSNNWTVNGNPVAFLTAIHPLWNINPGPGKWVSSVATGGTGVVPTGTYEYKLDFLIPTCSISQDITLSGNFGGDDDVQVFLDNTPSTSCAGGWCFNTPQKPLSTFTIPAVISGAHTLRIKVLNSGASPSGMFVNAKLTGACTSELTKPR